MSLNGIMDSCNSDRCVVDILEGLFFIYLCNYMYILASIHKMDMLETLQISVKWDAAAGGGQKWGGTLQ